MIETSLKDRALLVIECLVGGDFVVDAHIIAQIYRYAHVAREGKVCQDSHKDWEEELLKDYEAFRSRVRTQALAERFMELYKGKSVSITRRIGMGKKGLPGKVRNAKT